MVAECEKIQVFAHDESSGARDG
ncbi:MAG: hypothetical protein K0S78_3547, partial [Thermomicrobiales bacterium]|nr:hypothetical protein [Thermomicrobiales bacterium]